MTTSAQLERDAEACRAEVARTLDELRNRMSPGEVVNQLVDYARDGSGGQFVRNLQRQVVQNPLPLTLIGVGMAWLMMSGRRTDGLAGHDGRSSVMDGVRDASSTMSESAKATGENIRSTASAAYEAGADASAKLGHAATSMRDSATDLTQSVMNLFRDQPLVLAGLGLALGAAVGAALPGTETEDRLMGDASSDAKARAQDMAAQGAESAKNVAEHAFEDARHEAEKQGDSPDLIPPEGEHFDPEFDFDARKRSAR
jgi:hypothetical protein